MITAGQVEEITGTLKLKGGGSTDFTLYLNPAATSTKWTQYQTRNAEQGQFVDTLDAMWEAAAVQRSQADDENAHDDNDE